MTTDVSELFIQELGPQSWQRYRDIRLVALQESELAFGAKLEIEREFNQEQWQIQSQKYIGLVACIDGADIAFMTVENLDGDYGATCWIGGCWTNPNYRGNGALRMLFKYLDEHAKSRDWTVQGLGVWLDNYGAIAAYEKLGFVKQGGPKMSTKKPGLYFQAMVRGLPLDQEPLL